MRSKMEGLCPDKFAFVERSGTMKAPVGLLSDRTVLHSKMEGALPRQVPVCCTRSQQGLGQARPNKKAVPEGHNIFKN